LKFGRFESLLTHVALCWSVEPIQFLYPDLPFMCLQLAPMSTTTNIDTAVAYGMSKSALIFKIISENKLQRGADLQWVSAFPTEREFLYPPLTYLQPTNRQQQIDIEGYSFMVVEVKPTLAA
jgi:hypothetical protein